MKFSDHIKALNLPLDQIVVIGSGLLDQWGLRTAEDIDLVVTSEVLAVARASGEYDCGVRGTDSYCRKKALELWSNWGEDWPYERLVETAVVEDGVRFVAPNILVAKKRERGSDKDLRDIALLEAYDAGR